MATLRISDAVQSKRFGPAVAVAAAGILSFRGGERTLWRDEIWEYNITSSARLMLETMRLESLNGLTHVLVLFGWRPVAGTDEFLLRLPSILAMAVAIALAAVIARRFSASAALVVVGLALVHPVIWRYGQEARPYAFFAAAGTFALWALLRLVRTPDARWASATLALANLAMIYTHLYGWFYLAAQVVMLGLLATPERKLLARSIGFSALGGSVVPLIMITSTTEAYAWQTRPSVRTAYETAIEFGADSRVALAAMGVLAVAALATVARKDAAASERLADPLVLIAAWGAVPPVVGWTFSQAKPVWHIRYLLPSLPALLILVAVGVGAIATAAKSRRLVGPALAALALVAVLFAQALPGLMNFTGFEDFKSTATVIEQTARPGDQVVYTGGASLGHLHYAEEGLADVGDVEASYWWYGATRPDAVTASLGGPEYEATSYWVVSLLDGGVESTDWVTMVSDHLNESHELDAFWQFPNAELRYFVPRASR